MRKLVGKFTFLLRFAAYYFRSLIGDRSTAEFVAHNRRVWNKPVDATDGEILFELNSMCSAIIAYSYLANVLSAKHRANIVAYAVRKQRLFEKCLRPVFHKVYSSFNTLKVVYPDLNGEQSTESTRLFNRVYPGLETKRDVENLTIEGVWIGDLVYDSHLMKNNKPTVTISDPEFKKSLRKALELFVFWRDYFDTHSVKAVNVSHCVYTAAIILRIAIQKNVPAYQVNATHAYYLTEKDKWAYDDFFYFPMEFKKLSREEQSRGLSEARTRLEKRFSGQVGVDMNYSKISAYATNTKTAIIEASPRIKIFVAPHCFFDSPHPYGVSLFPDFYEWLNFLGGISEQTDYDWYIKTHPDFLPGNVPILEDFIIRYPKFRLLPARTSHHQIIAGGIDFALTVHGTIGFEYAALGVPVINASRCNPHIAYNFNIHPENIEDYQQILLDLPNQKLNIDTSEVYEYYYMKFIGNNVENWLLTDYWSFLDEIGGYNQQFHSISYKKFMEEFSGTKHEKILDLLERFVESKDYCMQTTHFARDHNTT